MPIEPQYPGRRLASPGYLVRIAFEKTNDDLTLQLALGEFNGKVKDRILFGGVRDFRLRTGSVPWGTPVEIYFEDISCRGMEDIRYRIWDAEEESFTFDCRTFNLTNE